jgi:hypothetical protein
MTQAADPIVISVPRAVLSDMSHMPADLIDRMHELLEHNTDGTSSPTEEADLNALVRMAQLSEIASLALQMPKKS